VPFVQANVVVNKAFFGGGGCGQGKWALWQFCPTTEESLKNAMAVNTKLTSKVPFLFGNFQFLKKNLVKNVQFSYGTTGNSFDCMPTRARNAFLVGGHAFPNEWHFYFRLQCYLRTGYCGINI
jgi:hypothetical protein